MYLAISISYHNSFSQNVKFFRRTSKFLQSVKIFRLASRFLPECQGFHRTS